MDNHRIPDLAGTSNEDELPPSQVSSPLSGTSNNEGAPAEHQSLPRSHSNQQSKDHDGENREVIEDNLTNDEVQITTQVSEKQEKMREVVTQQLSRPANVWWLNYDQMMYLMSIAVKLPSDSCITEPFELEWDDSPGTCPRLEAYDIKRHIYIPIYDSYTGQCCVAHIDRRIQSKIYVLTSPSTLDFETFAERLRPLLSSSFNMPSNIHLTLQRWPQISRSDLFAVYYFEKIATNDGGAISQLGHPNVDPATAGELQKRFLDLIREVKAPKKTGKVAKPQRSSNQISTLPNKASTYLEMLSDAKEWIVRQEADAKEAQQEIDKVARELEGVACDEKEARESIGPRRGEINAWTEGRGTMPSLERLQEFDGLQQREATLSQRLEKLKDKKGNMEADFQVRADSLGTIMRPLKRARIESSETNPEVRSPSDQPTSS